MSRATCHPCIKYRGWFMGLVPVYFGYFDHAEHGAMPFITARHWSLDPWFWLVELLAQALFFVLSLVKPDFEVSFTLSVTGKVNREGDSA